MVTPRRKRSHYVTSIVMYQVKGKVIFSKTNLRQSTRVGSIKAAATMWFQFVLIMKHLLWNTYTTRTHTYSMS